MGAGEDPLVWLKAYGRLGYFPDLFEVPLPIVDHIGRHLEFKPEVEPVHDSDRSAERHRDWVRERLGVTYDPPAARALAERVIREAVQFKDEPADLINVALEELVRARLELPGYNDAGPDGCDLAYRGEHGAVRGDRGTDGWPPPAATPILMGWLSRIDELPFDDARERLREGLIRSSSTRDARPGAGALVCLPRGAW